MTPGLRGSGSERFSLAYVPVQWRLLGKGRPSSMRPPRDPGSFHCKECWELSFSVSRRNMGRKRASFRVACSLLPLVHATVTPTGGLLPRSLEVLAAGLLPAHPGTAPLVCRPVPGGLESQVDGGSLCAPPGSHSPAVGSPAQEATPATYSAALASRGAAHTFNRLDGAVGTGPSAGPA